MLKVDLRRAKKGMKLALPVNNPRIPARNLLRVGYELDESIIRKIEDMGIHWVWVKYPSLDFLQKYLDRDAVTVRQQVVCAITDTFEQMQQKASAKLAYDTYTASIGELVEQLISHPQTALFLGDLSDASDELMRHSATVTYIAVLLGLKLETYMVRERKHVQPGRAKEVTNLGLGAMLHDIGITMLDDGVRRSFEETGDDSDPAYREHPALGFQEVRGKIEPSAATVVLNHHQRFDGSGYAGGEFPVLNDKRVHVFARIAAVADQFDRLHNPTGMPPQPTAWVLSAMLSEPMASKFDPQVLRALLEVVPPYPPGSIVRLSDDRYAVCIDHHPENPCRPTVQIIDDPDSLDVENDTPGETINLAEQSAALFVADSDGQDVSHLNFDAKTVARNTAGAAWS